MSELSKGLDRWRERKGFLSYYVSVNRRKRYFASPAERDVDYNREAAVRGLGLNDADKEPITPRDHFDLSEMKLLANGRAEHLISIFRAGLASLPKVSIDLVEARNEFVEEKEAAVEAKALKPTSFKQQKNVLDQMIREARFTQMADITNPAFSRWIRGRGLKPKGLHSFTKGLAVFLNWAVKKRYLAANPLKEMDVPEPPPKRVVFALAEVKRLLSLAQKNYPQLVPALALQWFAGIRPETSVLIDYADINRKKKYIRLRVGKFSQGEEEFVEKIPDAIWLWLPKQAAGQIAPANYDHTVTAFHKELGYTSGNPWPQDVARHTFASNFAAITGSIEAVAAALNHKSRITTLKYYHRRVEKADAIKYFSQRPGGLR